MKDAAAVWLLFIVFFINVAFARTADCGGTGDPHYRTFDGKRFNFMGICEYVFSKDLNNNFLVLTKNEQCNGRASCISTVTVVVKKIKIKIFRNGHFTVFGKRKCAPYSNRGIKVTKYGRRIQIKTNIGLEVRYDGVYNLYVRISSRYRRKTAGLCGNFNGIANDDFRDVDLQRTNDVRYFADSWKVDRSCPNAQTLPNPCHTAGPIARRAKNKCQLLKKYPFSRCHRVVKQAAGFIRDCEYDVCACGNHPTSCMCEEISAYATSCSLAGVHVSWKNRPQFRECKTRCATAPCHNGATCLNRGRNGFKCKCSHGYEGKLCTIRTCKNPKPLGMESKKIPDYRIRASSVWNAYHAASNARLNFRHKSGSWSSRRNDRNQWLQVDFKYKATVTDIITQGRRKYVHQWVRSYTVSYSKDGAKFRYYRKNRRIKLFRGNSHPTRIVKNSLHPIIAARFIRIHPKSWHRHISMRVEFVGCFEARECASHPCQNGGICKEKGNGYRCKCAKGFKGTNCEIDVPGETVALGDPHYRTLDGRRFNFMGICEYVFCKDLNNNFLVLTKNEQCNGRASCISTVTVVVKKIKIKIFRNGYFTVFGIRKYTPYSNRGIKVIKYGRKGIHIKTNIGLEVRFDGVYNLYVRISSRYRRNTAGLCGNFNGISRDDFRDVDLQLAHDVGYFANSWKVDRTCPNALKLPNPCHTAGPIARRAKKKCQLLKKYPFSRCHRVVKQAAGFIRDCEYDVCACGNHPTSCMCEEISAYATSCSLAGVHISWKNRPQFRECKTRCATAPCHNGATCLNRGRNGFKCKCSHGYEGKLCKIRKCKNPKPLGMEGKKIPDCRIRASSIWDANHAASNARLNFRHKSGSWSSRRNDRNQWLQVDFKWIATITDIITQGRRKYRHLQWVRSYTVSYSKGGAKFRYYRKNKRIKLFRGNSHPTRTVKNSLHPIIAARFIRIHPKSWYRHISMRVEFLGCFEEPWHFRG